MSFLNKRLLLIFFSIIFATGIIGFAVFGNTKITNISETKKTITYDINETNLKIEDSTSNTPDILPTKKETAPKNLTVTETAGREFITNYITFKNEYGIIDEDTKNEIVTRTINGTNERVFVYSLDDLDITPSTDKNTVKLYINNLGNILTENTKNITDNELNIIGRVVTENKNTEITKLDPIIKAYKQITTQLQSIIVPELYQKAHLDLLNYTVFLADDSTGMRQYFADPMRTMVAISNYQGDFYRFSKALSDIAEITKKLGVTFQQTDSGYAIINGI